MNSTMKKYGFQPLPLCVAISVAVSGLAWAEEEELKPFTKPDSSFSLGAGWVSDDNYYFSQYSSADDEGLYPLFSADINHRDDETGTWMRLNANTSGLRFEHNRQGDWKYSIGIDSMQRKYPFTYNTGLKGSTKDVQDLQGTGLRDKDYKLTRDNLRLGFSKWFAKEWSVDVNYRYEDKQGARPNGTGRFGFGPFFFTDPIDATTQELTTKVNFTGEALQLSAGVYGSIYNTKKEATELYIAGNPLGANPGAGLRWIDTSYSLPLDNSAWQAFVTGGYNFTDTTRGDFHLAYGRAEQDDDFYTPATNGQTSLDGKIDTLTAKLGIVSRPMPKLTLRANYRLRDRDDKTSEDGFTGSGANDVYVARDYKKQNLSGEASYRLPMNWKLTGGAEYQKEDRDGSPSNFDADRYKTVEENTYKIAVSKRLLDNLSGALQYSYSDRTNGGFRDSLQASGATRENDGFTYINMEERERNKVRLTMDWMPVEQLSLQVILEDRQDDYDRKGKYGVDEGEGQLASLDASYQVNDDWQVNAWVSADKSRIKQYNGSLNVAGDRVYKADLTQKGTAFGIGTKGTVTEELKVGLEYLYQKDRSDNDQKNVANLTVVDLDVIEYKQQTVKAFADYTVDPQSSVRLDYSYNKLKNDDWTWDPDEFSFSDGTTVIQDDNEIVHFVGATYRYSYQ